MVCLLYRQRLDVLLLPCRQVLALIVPSRLEFISSGDWAMISDWQTVGLCWCFTLIAFSSDVGASLVVPC